MTTTDQYTPSEDDRRLALAIAGSHDGVWDWDLQTDDVYFSDRCKSMLGYASEEVAHTLEFWRSSVHPDDLDRVLQARQRHFDGETDHYQAEYRMRHKEGHYLWILARGHAQRDANGQAVRLTGCLTDVTERRLAQDAVQNLGQELATILALSPDGFVAFDQQGRVKYVTAAFEGMTQLSAAQLQGLDEDQFWALLSTLCQQRSAVGNFAALRQNLNQSRNQRRSLLELIQPAGCVLMVKQSSSEASTIAKILCFRDVSYETEVDRLKSEFISTAAHELRTPLASIYGFAETLLSGETDEATRREFTDIIYQQSQVMTNLLNEMLDLARIEARRHTDFEFSRVDAQQLIRSVLDSFRVPEGRAKALLEVPGADVHVRVDSKKASQVVLNVLSNAYKYSPAGGAVQVRIERVVSSTSAAEVAIHISDQGMGMSTEQLSRLFERFYRAHPSCEIPGTGLGMSIVKEIMTLLDGHIDIQSAPGKGTCVSLYLPAA
jgi:PAS domain S-box-containing protein